MNDVHAFVGAPQKGKTFVSMDLSALTDKARAAFAGFESEDVAGAERRRREWTTAQPDVKHWIGGVGIRSAKTPAPNIDVDLSLL